MPSTTKTPIRRTRGGVGSRATDIAEDESTAGVSDQYPWRMEGDYLARVHREPRTTFFSPVDVPNDPPPIDVRNIEVLRTTKNRSSQARSGRR